MSIEKKCNYCFNEKNDDILLWDNELDKPNMVDYTCLCLSCYNNLSKKRPKKDNSKKGDIFLNCRCCGVSIRPDWYSQIDKRYCADCL